MRKNIHSISPAMTKQCYLPDFCQSETNLLLILVLELLALVLALSSADGSSGLFIQLALISIFMLWIGLVSAALLCVARRVGVLQGVWKGTLFSLLVVALVTIVMTMLAYQLNEFLKLELFREYSILMLVLRFTAISLILYGLALRYFYIQHVTGEMMKTESRSRLQALQARIRPHFLFNSLNTIASLTHDEPDKAERATEDLAELFRASLKADTEISLQSEIELTRDYINLESLRLDDRLRVRWLLGGDLQDLTMPALILQPLVENAIYHGIEPLAGGGEVVISIQYEQNLQIEISNPLDTSGMRQHRQGNQMALENISERLQLAYQGRAKIQHVVENDLYKVTITIPVNHNESREKSFPTASVEQ